MIGGTESRFVLALLGVVFLGFSGELPAQEPSEDFGRAVQRSLARSHLLYPDAAQPNSRLSDAILVQIDWMNRNEPTFFSDADWPMKLTASEALRLGIRARVATPRPAPTVAPKRYLGLVTKNFSVTGASFRKGQQLVLEKLQDNGKRAVTFVQGEPFLLWLDHIKLIREIRPGESRPTVVKIVSARYGLPGTTGYAVSGEVQTLLGPNSGGTNQILVSDALLSPSAAQRLNRAAVATTITDPVTGRVVPVYPKKVLTVTYQIDGEEKTVQAEEGDTLAFD